MNTEKPPKKRRLFDIKKEVQEESVSLNSRGRPPLHEETWTRATTILFDSQIHWLDTLAANIRLKNRKSISRAELIRALISAAIESGLDLSNITTEEDLKNFILKKLKA